MRLPARGRKQRWRKEWLTGRSLMQCIRCDAARGLILVRLPVNDSRLEMPGRLAKVRTLAALPHIRSSLQNGLNLAPDNLLIIFQGARRDVPARQCISNRAKIRVTICPVFEFDTHHGQKEVRSPIPVEQPRTGDRKDAV